MSELRWPLAACSVAAFVFVAVSSCSEDETTSTGGPSSPAANVTSGPTSSTSNQTGSGATGGTPSSGGNGMGGSSSSTSASAGGGNAGGSSGSAYDCSPPAGSPFALKLTTIVSVSQPVLVKSEPEDASRLYVLQQPGIITLVINGTPSTFLDIQNIVNNQGNEQGLLGLAFHPDYANNGRFFVHYTDNGGDTAIAEYARNPNNFNVALTTGTVFFTINDFASNHNGGAIEFGPDGMLYIFMGDGGGGGDPNETGQNINSRLGKVHRLNIDPTAYTPAGVVPNGLPEIWDYGLRNPWRASFDACTGDLYIGDVGQNAWEEVNYQAGPTTSGVDYQWDDQEARHFHELPVGVLDGTPPVLEYAQGPGCSVTGGYVYRGCAMPDIAGRYFYSDYCDPTIRSFQGVLLGDAQNVMSYAGLNSSIASIVSFGEDARGEIYIADYGDLSGSSGLGEVYRIVPGP